MRPHRAPPGDRSHAHGGLRHRRGLGLDGDPLWQLTGGVASWGPPEVRDDRWIRHRRCGRSRSSSNGLARPPTGCGPSAGRPRWCRISRRASWTSGCAKARCRPCPGLARPPPRPSRRRPPASSRPTWQAAGGAAAREPTGLRAAMRGDCHTHSDWSDGGSPPLEMAEAARDLGHEWIALTDHSPRLTVANGLSAERLRAQLELVGQLNAQLAPFRILTGIEVDILEDGTLDQDDDLLGRLDVVVASVHSKLRMPAGPMTERMVAAVSSPHVDVLGHCTGRMLTARDRSGSGAAGRIGLRPGGGVRCLPRPWRRGRDQLPARTPGPARPAAPPGRRGRLRVRHRHRRARARPARLARQRLRESRGARPRPRAGDQLRFRSRPAVPAQTTGRAWAVNRRLQPRARSASHGFRRTNRKNHGDLDWNSRQMRGQAAGAGTGGACAAGPRRRGREAAWCSRGTAASRRSRRGSTANRPAGWWAAARADAVAG